MEGVPLVVLPREVFAGSATAVAPTVLGCVLEHETPEGLVAVMLTEVEAYMARGPGRLCKALDITRAQDGADVCDPASPLRVRWPDQRETLDISQGPRIGISVATDFPWRFWVTGDPTVSAYRPYTPRLRRKPVSAQ